MVMMLSTANGNTAAAAVQCSAGIPPDPGCLARIDTVCIHDALSNSITILQLIASL